MTVGSWKSSINPNDTNHHRLKTDFFQMAQTRQGLEFRMGFTAVKLDHEKECLRRSILNDKLVMSNYYILKRQILLKVQQDTFLVNIFIRMDTLFTMCKEPINDINLVLVHLNGTWNCKRIDHDEGENLHIFHRDLTQRSYQMKISAEWNSGQWEISSTPRLEEDLYHYLFSLCQKRSRSSRTWITYGIAFTVTIILIVFILHVFNKRPKNAVRPISS